MRFVNGVVLKQLRSFSQLINPNHLINRTSLNSRFNFAKFFSSSSSTASLTVGAAAPVSLGHSTRPDFEILHQKVRTKAFFRNRCCRQLLSYHSNVHRGIHFLSAKAIDEYELSRKKVAAFINASESSEIVFTGYATEAINLFANSWGFSNLKPKDEVCLFYSFLGDNATKKQKLCSLVSFFNSFTP